MGEDQAQRPSRNNTKIYCKHKDNNYKGVGTTRGVSDMRHYNRGRECS